MAGPGVGPLIKFNHFRVHIRYDEIAFSSDFLYSGKIPLLNASIEAADPFLGVYGKLRAAAKKHLIAAHADPVIHDFHIRPGNQFSVSTVNLHPVGVRRIPVPENESGKSITGKRADNLILEFYRSVFHRFSVAAKEGDTVIPEDCGYRITYISDVRDHYAGITQLSDDLVSALRIPEAVENQVRRDCPVYRGDIRDRKLLSVLRQGHTYRETGLLRRLR